MLLDILLKARFLVLKGPLRHVLLNTFLTGVTIKSVTWFAVGIRNI